jgi:hypothetical protein
LGEGDDYVYHGKTKFKGLHTHTELQLTKLQQETFKKSNLSAIYPEYYILKVDSFDNKAKSKLDEWIYFFKNNEIKDEFTAKGLEKAKEVLDYDKLSTEEKKDYNNLLRIRINDAVSLRSAKDTGLAEGIELGKAEEKESIVVESFKNGLSFEIISAITKLPKEEIISFWRNMNYLNVQ